MSRPEGPRRRTETSRRRFPSGGHRRTAIDATGVNGKQVVAILVRAHVPAGADVIFAPRTTFIRPSGSCGPYPPSPKALDKLHPDAVQPAAPVVLEPDASRFIIETIGSSDVEGWLSWQVELPPTGCAYRWTLSPVLYDLVIPDTTNANGTQGDNVYGQEAFEIDPK